MTLGGSEYLLLVGIREIDDPIIFVYKIIGSFSPWCVDARFKKLLSCEPPPGQVSVAVYLTNVDNACFDRLRALCQEY